MSSTAVGSFALVLHAHQPFVLGHGRWPHGSDWLCEAVVQSYLPLLRTLRTLSERGVSPRVTLSYLPLLGRDESVGLQLRLAVLTHEAYFGRRPRGVWLPECAYRPRYEWIPPVGPHRQQRRALRRGTEEFLAECGLEFFFADSQTVLGGRPLPPYDDHFPELAS